MLPDWLGKTDEYTPVRGDSSFSVKSIKAIGKAMSQIKVQRGHEKGRTLPPLLKLLLTFGVILMLSLSQNRLLIMAYAAGILSYLCTWPPRDIAGILKSGGIAAVLALLLLFPAVIMKPALISNELFIVVKVFFSMLTVSIFNHTTQWNHVTGALRQLHIPGIFVFTIDITLKYIVLLGNLICDLLTSLQLRSVGKNNRRYQSVGGVMGVTFIRGTEMNRQMYEAMQCRGFTDDYKGL